MSQKKQNRKFNYAQLSKDIWAKRSSYSPALGLKNAAEKAGTSAAALYRLESQSGKPDVDTLISVCNWLDKPIQHYCS